MNDNNPVVLVLGAGGLIGGSVSLDLKRSGFPVVAAARRLTPAQKAALGGAALEAPLVNLDAVELAKLVAASGACAVVNCIGLIQDASNGDVDDVHVGFVRRLTHALAIQARPALLIHLSMPGEPEGDVTPFSRSKRTAEALIAASGLEHVILRPGFVLGPMAYGGSAMLRALAVLPFALPKGLADRPFSPVSMRDVSLTVMRLATGRSAGERGWNDTLDLVAGGEITAGDVLDGLRQRLGGPRPVLACPDWLVRIAAKGGDLLGRLGWRPPLRTTVVEEIRRGVSGDPAGWTAKTGIEPDTLAVLLDAVAPSVQESWFARLYLLKAVILGVLSTFWVASGVLALTLANASAKSILVSHGIGTGLADWTTAVTAAADIAVGSAIAVAKWSRAGLLAGLALSASYMAGSMALAPELWLDPVGSMLKTVPAAVLMVTALALSPSR